VPGTAGFRGNLWGWLPGTGVAMEGTGGKCPPLGAYSFTQNSAKNAPKHVILTPKMQKFPGEGAQTLSPWGGDIPPHTSPLKCPTTTAPRPPAHQGSPGHTL